jgi:hypothetical protein
VNGLSALTGARSKRETLKRHSRLLPRNRRTLTDDLWHVLALSCRFLSVGAETSAPLARPVDRRR